MNLPAALLLICSGLSAATLQEKPTSFCYGTIGRNIQARLQLHNSDARETLRVRIRVQTIGGKALADPVDRELGPAENYETVFQPSDQLQQIWAVLTVTGYRQSHKGDIPMHSDGPLEGAMITEKMEGAEVKTRTSTLTPILVQDPHDRPRGVEPNKAVHRLGAFFTGEYVFIGNPRDRQLDLSFCAVRTGRCWQYGLPARSAVSVSLADFEAALGIASLQDYVSLNFGSATAFCNMRNGSADSAITFGDVAPSPSRDTRR